MHEPVVIDPDSARRLLGVAAKRAAGLFRPTTRTEAVWVQGDSELAVGLADVTLETRDGLIIVGIPVRCDQIQPSTVTVDVRRRRAQPPGRALRRDGAATAWPGDRHRHVGPGPGRLRLAVRARPRQRPGRCHRQGRARQRARPRRAGGHARRHPHPADGPPPLLGVDRPEVTITNDDLGVLGNLATAIGLMRDGSPNPDWFGDARGLAEDDARQRRPARRADRVRRRGDGRRRPRHGPQRRRLAADPLARRPPRRLRGHRRRERLRRRHRPRRLASARRHRRRARRSPSRCSGPSSDDGPNVGNPVLLGQAAGRIRLATSITVDDGPPEPGVARLGAIGLDVDLPTSTNGADPVFGLSLDGFQLPGATAPREPAHLRRRRRRARRRAARPRAVAGARAGAGGRRHRPRCGRRPARAAAPTPSPTSRSPRSRPRASTPLRRGSKA